MPKSGRIRQIEDGIVLISLGGSVGKIEDENVWPLLEVMGWRISRGGSIFHEVPSVAMPLDNQ